MATTQAVWGIDLGRCALKAIKLRQGADGKVELLAHDYIEHPKILSQPDADRQELISSALEKFLSRNDISKDQVMVSVPGQHTLARFSKLPPVAQKKIPELVRYEADQQIPFDMDEVIWDYQTFQEPDMPDIEVGIFAMKRELIREHLLHFEQAAIEPIGVQSGPLAVYNAAHRDELLTKETTILLDIGAECTDVVIATPSRLWTRTVPIGGNNFTDALVKSFKLSFAKAETLKRTAASSKYARQIFQTMRPVFADIVQELQRSIGFYSSTHRDAHVEKVVGVGNAFLLPGLQKYLQQNLSMPVELPKSLRVASASEGTPAVKPIDQILTFWVSYGLALQGLDLTKITTNLLPREIAKQVVWRKKRPAFAAAAACLVLAGGIIWFRYTSDMRALAASSDGAAVVAVAVEQAPAFIDSPPSASLSPRAQAATILAAAGGMGRELQNLSGQGDTERSQAEDLVQALRQKTMIPAIFQVIHESLPVPEVALRQGATAKEMIDAMTKVPRGERQQVFIQSLSMDYMLDVDDPPWLSSLVGVEQPIHDFESGDAFEGILIKIICRTPNQNAVGFINKHFLEPLRRNGRRPGAGFYFDRVYLLRGEKVQASRVGQAGAAMWGSKGRGGAGGRGTPFSGGASRQGGRMIARDPAILDPLTDESVLDDMEFEIWVDAFMEDYENVAPAEEDAKDEG